MIKDGQGRSEPQTVLITGQSGRLSQALRRQVWPQALRPLYLGRDQLDLLGPGDLGVSLAELGVQAVINTAAYTDVDKAETEPEAAYGLNRDGVANLAKACAALDMSLIHVSTDYVFGAGRGPFSEADPVTPLGVYGASKLAGEQALWDYYPRGQVVRTAWLFDGHSPNFLTTMLGLRDRPQLDVIQDQSGSPTLTDHLARGLIELVQRRDEDLPRLLHFANQGGATRFEMAQTIFAKLNDAGPKPVLQPVLASQWPALAQRPSDSRLSTRLWVEAGLTPPAPWQDAIEEGVAQWRTKTGGDL